MESKDNSFLSKGSIFSAHINKIYCPCKDRALSFVLCDLFHLGSQRLAQIAVYGSVYQINHRGKGYCHRCFIEIAHDGNGQYIHKRNALPDVQGDKYHNKLSKNWDTKVLPVERNQIFSSPVRALMR